MAIVLMNSNAKTLQNIILINSKWHAQLVFLLVVNAQLKVYVKPVFLGTCLETNVYWSVLLNIILILYLETACLATQLFVWHVVWTRALALPAISIRVVPYICHPKVRVLLQVSVYSNFTLTTLMVMDGA